MGGGENATKNVDVRRALFNILLDCVKPSPPRLRYFRNEDIAPHVYDQCIESWGMFPHHD